MSAATNTAQQLTDARAALDAAILDFLTRAGRSHLRYIVSAVGAEARELAALTGKTAEQSVAARLQALQRRTQANGWTSRVAHSNAGWAIPGAQKK